MVVYATLILAGVARDLSVVEVVGATLGAFSVVFQSFLTSLRTGVQHGRNFVVVFNRFGLQLFQVYPLQEPRIGEESRD